MVKIGRNAPCLCGSGKKYKKCCLSPQQVKRPPSVKKQRFIPVYTELDQLSNSVVDLINENKLDEAEAVSRELLTEYPDQIDGFNRLAMVYEARGEKERRQSTIERPTVLQCQMKVLTRTPQTGFCRRLNGWNLKNNME